MSAEFGSADGRNDQVRWHAAGDHLLHEVGDRGHAANRNKARAVLLTTTWAQCMGSR